MKLIAFHYFKILVTLYLNANVDFDDVKKVVTLYVKMLMQILVTL